MGLGSKQRDAEFNNNSGESLKLGEGVHLPPELWATFHHAASDETFAASWLSIICNLIGKVQHAVVVLGPAGKGPYAPLAYWPDDVRDGSSLAATAELAMTELRGVVRSNERSKSDDEPRSDTVALPIIVDDLLCGVIAIKIVGKKSVDLPTVMYQLQWGCGCLEALIRRKAFSSKDRLVSMLDLVAVILEQKSFRSAATALTSELARDLDCEWVALGFTQGSHTRVQAFSNSAVFENKTNLHRSIGAAMDEAIEQQTILSFPGSVDNTIGVIRVHTELAERAKVLAICTVPISDDGHIIGAIMFARANHQPFNEKTLEFCRHLGLLTGPILAVKQRDDRWIIRKVWDSSRHLTKKLIGFGHVKLKLSAILLVCVALFLFFAEGDYRVSADTYIEGSIQRVITAPIDGYVEHAYFRAGDTVKAGDVLSKIEDKDLQLERAKWVSQREQRQREYSKALSARDRAQVRILDAQIEQANSQLGLVDKQLARTELIAPYDGIIVKGDLSQSLGMPVARGDILFEVAPLNSYRVILEVDERDISQVSVGQIGNIALASLTGETFSLQVTKITPISSAQDGRNIFKVEASLDEASLRLRPGMKGVGKIFIDKRNLFWIWTHKIVHWFRYWWWSWWP